MNVQLLSDGEGALSAVFAHALPTLTRPLRTGPPPLEHADAKPTRISALKRAAIEETRAHARRLAVISASVGRLLALPSSDIDALALGGLLHDIGKIAIPPQVLFKCGRLSAEEFAAVKYHTVIGDLLCARVPALEGVRPIVRHHHERLDGTGYPDRLFGDAIPLLAQIVGIADVYDALVCSRPYKPAFDRDHAFSILRRESEHGWRRSDLVEALIEVVEREGDRLSLLNAV